MPKWWIIVHFDNIFKNTSKIPFLMRMCGKTQVNSCRDFLSKEEEIRVFLNLFFMCLELSCEQSVCLKSFVKKKPV